MTESNQASLYQWLLDNGFGSLGINNSSAENDATTEAWQASTSDKQAAWEIYTQLRSRVTTRDLRFRDGQDRAALSSVYTLFETVRLTADKYGPDSGATIAIAMTMLNEVVRPFNSKWHRLDQLGQLKNNDQRGAFRTELRALQSRLQDYENCFAVLAGQEKPLNFEDPCQTPARSKDPGRSADSSLPGPMLTAEREYIVERRRSLSGYSTQNEGVTGLAISGGGIRSATFALGLTSRLARMGLFRHVDYLSTVSGGGYLGSMIAARLRNSTHDGSTKIVVDPFSDANQKPADTTHRVDNDTVRHLRNHSKELGEELPRGLGYWARGVAVNLLMLIAAAIFLALCVGPLFGAVNLSTEPDAEIFPLSCWPMLLRTLPVALIALALRWQLKKSAFANRIWAKRLEHVLRAIASIAAIAFALSLVSRLLFNFQGVNQWGLDLFRLLPFAIVSLLSVWLSYRARREHFSGKLLQFISIALGWLFILACLSLIAVWLSPIKSHWPYAIVLVAIGAMLAYIVDINTVTLAPYYRRALANTWLAKIADKDKPKNTASADKITLTQSATRGDNKAQGYAPYHLINAAINLPSSSLKNLRGRQADFLLFSPFYCGSPCLSRNEGAELPADIQTEENGYYRSDSPAFEKISVATAVAVSGAAASPMMGRNNRRSLAPWLATMNFRLGHWCANPCKIAKHGIARIPKAWLLWREMLFRTDEGDAFINISDGGHIENLGVYELLRRRCRFIISIDGEADPDMSFDGLIRLFHLAKVDFGIDIELDFSDILPQPEDSYAHFALGRIHYPEGGTGYLLYIKSSLTGNEKHTIEDYKRKNPDFPHETTADQFFGEEQFEAYRALGEHVGNDLFRDIFIPPELPTVACPTDETDWFRPIMERPDGMLQFFEQLRQQLLPDEPPITVQPCNTDE